MEMEMKRCRSSDWSSGVDIDIVVMRKKIKSSITSIIPDEILEEILSRLPHLRSAIQCGTVCKRWLSIISGSNFIANFVKHIHRSNPPLRLLLGSNFNFFRHPIRINQYTIPKIAGIFDSFNSNLFPPDSTLLAMCNDLLLVRISRLNYCICNPLTGQTFSLPPPRSVNPRRIYIGRCGLVSEPPNNNGNEHSNTRYRVMIIYHSRDNQTSRIRAYFSETGKWLLKKKTPTYLSVVNSDVVASNGFFYWIAFELGRVITLNLFGFKERWVCVGFPDPDYQHSLQLKLGLFQGQPRLSQLLRVDTHHLSLKVWDLIYTNGFDAAPSWLLVHQVVLNFEDADVVFVLGFHPSHSDQIFMLHNSNFYQYDVKTNKRIVVAEIHSNTSGKMPVLPIFPFVLPVWPTRI